MAGYKPQRKLYKLKFADEEYEGLEVLASSASLGTMLEIQELSDKLGERLDAATAVELNRRMIAIFCGAVKSWNLVDDDGEPMPVSVDSMSAQDPNFVMALLQSWTTAVAGVSVPLDGGSPSGGTSLEASLPMAPLSPSPAS